jgi:hypothetical protein
MKLIEKSPVKVQKAMSNILYVFGGDGGGVPFYKFCQLINYLSEQLNDENQKESATKLLNNIIQFDNLIKVAQNEIKSGNEVS